MTDSATAPAPGEQSTAPANLPANEQQNQVAQEVDQDEQALRDAKAEAEAEKAEAQGGEEQPGEQAQAQPDQTQRQEPVPMIPKPRVDEIISQRDRASQEAAYWRGVAEATKAHQPASQAQPGAQQPQPQQPTAEQQRLAAVHSKQDELASKFDNGEITYSDLTKQARELTNQEQAIRDEISRAKTAPQQQQPKAPEVDLYLDQLTAELEISHPWVQVLDKVGTDTDWGYIRQRAIENLVSKGIDPNAGGKRATFELRREMAEMIDQVGPFLLTDRANAKGIAIPGSQPQAQPGQRSPTAQARAAKMDLASRAPPQVSRMTGSTEDNVAGVPSDSRLEAMSDDEIGALPDSIRRKFLGLTA